MREQIPETDCIKPCRRGCRRARELGRASGGTSCSVSSTNRNFAIPGSITTVLFLPQTTVLNFMAVLSAQLIYHNTRIGVSWQYFRRLFSATDQHSVFCGSTQAPFFVQSYCLNLHLLLLWQSSIKNCAARIAKVSFCGRIPAEFILPQLYFSPLVAESDPFLYRITLPGFAAVQAAVMHEHGQSGLQKGAIPL